MRAHTCHAYNCERACSPSKLFCPQHWRMVPKALQDALWAAYKPGQENRMDPSIEYLHAAADCVRAVAHKEGFDVAMVEADPAVRGYMALAEILSQESQ